MPARGRVAAVTGVLIVLGASALAHQDAVVTRSKSGELRELPETYQPARLVVTGGRDETLKVDLRLGDNIVEFPPCLASLFDLPKGQRIVMSASWYHEPTTLPYYLSIVLPIEGRKWGERRGWSLLIALESAELIKLRRIYPPPDSHGQFGETVELSDICTPAEISQIAPRAFVEDRLSSE